MSADAALPFRAVSDPVAETAPAPDPYAGPDRRSKVEGGTALSQALTSAASGAAAGAAQGSMGFRGMVWTNVGNASAMAVLCVILLFGQYEQTRPSREQQVIFREEVRRVQEYDDRRYERTVVAFDRLGTAVESQTAELRRALVVMEAIQRRQGNPPHNND